MLPLAQRARSTLSLLAITSLAGLTGSPTHATSPPEPGLRWDLSLSAPSAAPPQGNDTATPWSHLLEVAAQQAATNRMADANVQAAQAQHKQVWSSAWMPRVDLNAGSSRQQQVYNGTSSSTPATAISLTTTLPLWRAADRANAQAQNALTDLARWQARSQRVLVARELSLAYLAAAEAAEQRRLAQAQLSLLQKQLHINDRRLQAGLGTMLDQLETRTRMDQTRASIRELGMRVTSQRLTIERLSGQGVRIPAGLSQTSIGTPDLLPSLDEALQQAAQDNPQLQDARARLAAARATTSARDAEYWQPTLDASATASRTHQTQRFEGITDQQDVSTKAIGVQLNWPLFTGGYQQGRVQEAAALLTRAQAGHDDAEAAAQSGLRDAYQSLTQAQVIIAAQQDVEQTASATYEAVNKAFVAGLRTNLDLLNAQQQIHTARQSLVAARVTALSAHVNILALLDQLDAQHVAPLSAQFDPEPMPESAP
ncbi:MAG: TolC family protein [Burkholderiales bacterium]|nr:TolC family protein [Burkholderiales bacterium]